MRGMLTAATAALCVLVLTGTATAENAANDMSDEMRSELVTVQIQIRAINDAERADQMTSTAASHMRRQYLRDARAIAHRDISIEELMALSGDPAVNESWAPSWLSLVNVMYTAGALLVAICLLLLTVWVFGPYLYELFRGIPKEFWEGLMAVAGLSLIYVGTFAGSAGPYIAAIGCIMFSGALFIIQRVHRIEKFRPEIIFVLSGVACAVAAVVFGSEMNGFLAVVCLVSALGFSFGATPLFFYIGFEEESKVPNATLACFIMLGIYMAMHVAGATNEYVEPFKFGALWIGAFVGYVGLLIMSSKWYDGHRAYGGMQLVMILAMIAGLVVGTLFNIDYVAKIAGTFGVLWLVEKTFEIPVKSRVSYAWLGLLAGGVLFAAAWAASTYADVLGPYLLF